MGRWERGGDGGVGLDETRGWSFHTPPPSNLWFINSGWSTWRRGKRKGERAGVRLGQDLHSTSCFSDFSDTRAKDVYEYSEHTNIHKDKYDHTHTSSA